MDDGRCGVLLAALAACGWAAELGELWLRIEDTGGGDRVVLNLPVSELREPGEPAWLHTGEGRVDLRAEARRLRVGAERRWTDRSGSAVSLAHAPPASTPVTLLGVAIGGPRGGGLEATFPLEPGSLGQVNAEIGDLAVSVDGLDLQLDEEAAAQLRRSGPVLLAEIVGPEGKGLRIRTK